MYKVREVLHCRPGKVRDMVNKFKEVGEVMKEKGYTPFSLCTDVSGEQFWTVTLESEHESLAEYEAMEATVMKDERFGTIMAGYHDLVVSGRREIFRVEA